MSQAHPFAYLCQRPGAGRRADGVAAIGGLHLPAPAGCVLDPAARSGLSSFTCEMVLRGAGERDGRQFILDLDGLGVERARGGLQRPRHLQRRHGGGEPAGGAGHLRRPAAAAAPARRTVGIVPPGGVAGPAGGGGRAGGKGDDRACGGATIRIPGAVRHRASKRPWRPPR